MATPEPEPTAREIAQRTRSRLPSSLTGSERRIDGLEAKIDRLGEHVIDRLGDMDAKLDRLLSRTDFGQTPSS
ncbi:MAG: hypothetical protein OXH38_09450 [Chloroflexi bacterium]|nr:hypothetical protein [Chloroflexota bacterium]